MYPTNRKLHRWLVWVFLLCTTTGCWNRVELNELAVSVAMGLDKEGELLLLSHQVVNPAAIAAKGGASSGDAPVTLFQMKGTMVQEAARRMATQSTRKIYVGHLQMLVISEEVAEMGVSELLDHITRDHQYRRDFYVVVAKGTKAENILKLYTPVDKIPASKMQASLQSSTNAWGSTADLDIKKFMADLISKGKEAVVTGITVKGDQEAGESKENVEAIHPFARLQFSNLAVFRKDKIVGWLNEEESKGYNYSQGNIESTVVVFPCPEGNSEIGVEVLRTEADISFQLKNGKQQMTIDVSLEGNISDVECALDLSDPKIIEKVAGWTEKKIKKTIESAVVASQKKYHSDILGFGKVIKRSNPQYWNEIAKDWDQEFRNIPVHVKVKADIRRVFKTKKTFQERVRE